jgi:WD40 repeat protein
MPLQQFCCISYYARSFSFLYLYYVGQNALWFGMLARRKQKGIFRKSFMTNRISPFSDTTTQALSSLFGQHMSRRTALVGLMGLVLAGCGSPTGGDTTRTSPSPTAPPVQSTPPPTPTPDEATPETVDNPGRTYVIFKGHHGNVNAVAWSPDSKYIASGGNDNLVQVWDTTSGTPLMVYKGHPAAVLSLTWSPDGATIASGGGAYGDNKDYSVRVWTALTGKDSFTYDEHKGVVTIVRWSYDGQHIASASSAETSVHVWEAQTGKTTTTYSGNDDSVSSLAWSPDSKSIVSGVATLMSGVMHPTVKIWKSLSGDEILTYPGQGANALAWSPDGKLIASTNNDKIQIWDAASGKDQTTLQSGNSAVLTLAWSPDGKYLVSGGGSTQSVGSDNIAQVWNVSTKQAITTYRSHQLPVSSVSWSPDGTRVASGSWDGVVRVWQAI